MSYLYEPHPRLIEAIEAYNNPAIVDGTKELLETINELNNLYVPNIFIDLDTIETEYMEEYDDEDRTYPMEPLYYKICDYLGIKFDVSDATIGEIVDVAEALVVILSSSHWVASNLLDTFASDMETDKSEQLLGMLAEHTSVGFFRLYDIIDDIEEDLYHAVIDRLSYIVSQATLDGNQPPQIYQLYLKLIKEMPLFGDSRLVSWLLSDTFLVEPFENNIRRINNLLPTLPIDRDIIAREIAFVKLFSTLDIEDSELFDYVLLDNFYQDNEFVKSVMAETFSLLNRARGVLK